jgi:monothiol glutaredoxin
MTSTPNSIRQITALELKAMLDRGAPFEFWDVRTVAERNIATIPGAKLLDSEAVEHIEALDRGTLLVFHCHHGIRSQNAALHFLSMGFTNLCNLSGGIAAWSQDVDPSVAQY